MNEIKEAILLCLRQGKDPDDIIRYLTNVQRTLTQATSYQPYEDVALFAQAIKDSHFAP